MTSFPWLALDGTSPHPEQVEHWEYIYGLHGNSTGYEMLGKMKQGNLRNEEKEERKKKERKIKKERKKKKKKERKLKCINIFWGTF